MRNLIIIPSLCIILGACGGGGGGNTSQPKPVKLAPTHAIQLFGDSTQNLAAPSWVARYGDVVNSAAPGTTSTQLLNGTDGVNQPWPYSVVGRIVVIKHGTNDAGYRVTTVDQYKANLRALYAGATGSTVVFETPDPSTDPNRIDTLPPFVQAMREVAAELHAPLIDTYACWTANPDWPNWLTDGTHANAIGQRYTVETCVAPIMDALVK